MVSTQVKETGSNHKNTLSKGYDLVYIHEENSTDYI